MDIVVAIVTGLSTSALSIGGLIAYLSKREGTIQAGIEQLKIDVGEIKTQFARRDVLHERFVALEQRLQSLEKRRRR